MQFSFLLHTLSILYILLYSCECLKVSSSILVNPKFFFYNYYFIFTSNCTYVFLSIFPITFSYSSSLSFIVHLVALLRTFPLHRTHRWVSFIKPKAMQKQQLSKASSSSGVAQSSIKKSNSNSIFIYVQHFNIYRFHIIHIYKSLASLCKSQRLFSCLLEAQRKKKWSKKKMRKQKKQNYTQESWEFLQQQQYLKTLYNIYTL